MTMVRNDKLFFALAKVFQKNNVILTEVKYNMKWLPIQ